MIEPRSVHRVEHLVSDISIAVDHIRALCQEFTDQSAEMLSALDKPPPALIAKRNAISAAVAGGHGADQLKAPQRLPLAVTLPQERLNELRILAIAQCLRIQGEIHVQGADMRHVRMVEQQPGNGAADDGELAPVAPQDLPDLHQNRSDGSGGAVVVV